MQFNVITFAFAAFAAVAVADKTVTVYECPATASPSTVTSGAAKPTGVASTGVVTAPTPTGSPIFTGAGATNGISGSALGLLVAGGVALFL